VAFGGGSEDYARAVEQALTPIWDAFGKPLSVTLSPEEVERLRLDFLSEARRTVPAILSISAMSITLSNLWVGAFVARKSGYLARPLSLGTLDYPKATALALIAAFLLSRADGFAALAGIAFLGTLVLAYFILGAVAMVALTAGSALRPLVIIAILLSMVIEPLAIVLAIFGLAENLIQFRRRRNLPPPAGTPPIR
jgi:hypothetical protein